MAGEYKKALEAIKDPVKRAELEKALSEVGEFADELDKGYMRQSDYSRKQDELKAEKAQLQTNWDKANKQFLEMQAELDETLADRDSTKAEKEEAARKLAAAEQKLKDTPQLDASKFLSKEDFEKAQREYAAGQTAYFGDVLDIADEHLELFGKRIKPRELIQEAMLAKQTPTEYWEAKYNVKAKREEISKGAEEKRQQEWEKKGYEKRLAEEANPNTRTFDASKNPFYETSKEGKALQPWDVDEVPDAERDFKNELAQARG